MTSSLPVGVAGDISAWRPDFLDAGFLRLDNMIGEAELTQLERVYDACFDAEHDSGVRRKELGGRDAQGRAALPQVMQPSQQFPELLELDYAKKARQVTSEAFETDEVELRFDHMIFKPAGYGIATPWHQDQAYHDPSQRYRNINFWLPLDGATIEGGCMHYVYGSHRGPILPHSHLHAGDNESALVATDQEYWNLNGTAAPCRRGACTLHHSYCMHYAGPNRSDIPRRAYILVFGIPPLPARHVWRFPWKE